MIDRSETKRSGDKRSAPGETGTSSSETSFKEFRDEARRHVRILLGTMIVVWLFLAGLLAKGFHWI